jgi:DNA-binding NarL/FixJ family response regulator
VVSAICFIRESLVEILCRVDGMRVTGQASTMSGALDAAQTLRPAIIVLDVAFPGGAQTAMRLSEAAPEASVIALGVSETEEDVLAWAEAGIAGYVPSTASVDDMIMLVGEIGRGEQTCPSRIAGSLLRRVGAARRAAPDLPIVPPLTRRELEILGLVGAGLSNKDIARRLRISLGTTKSHVHNLLGKLSLQRRADVMARIRDLPWPATARPNEVTPPFAGPLPIHRPSTF